MGLRYLGNIIRPGYDPLASNITTGVNTAQHQGVFTLQQQAQAQSTQSWVTEPLFKSNTLLLQADNTTNGLQNGAFLDSSANNFSITRNGDATQNTYTPYSAPQGAWSNYFDGTADYLTAAGANLALGTGNFTIEFWFYANAYSATADSSLMFDSRSGNNTSGFFIGPVFNNTQTLHVGQNTTPILTANRTYQLGVWIHCAVVRSSGTITLYQDGISVGSVANTTNNTATTNYIASGWWLPTGAGQTFNGYLSNLRVSNTARYTANFTPPAAMFTSDANTVLLTCQNSRFIDNSSNAYAVTPFNTAAVNSFSPFPPQNQWAPSTIGGAGGFDGTGDYLSTTGNAAFAFGTGDFTLEVWVNLNSISTATFDRICATSDYNGSGFDWALNTGASALFLAGASYGFSVPIRQWNHLVYTRSGTALRGFLNGRLASYNASVGQNISSTTSLLVGAGYSGSSFNGAMTDLRIIKGSIPTDYQTNSTTTGTQIFTPPSAPVTTTSQGATAGNVSYLLNFTNAGIYDNTARNNLSLFGNTQVSTSIKRYGSGSIFFDGSGDYLTLPNAPQTIGVLSPTTNLTIEGWIYHTQRPAFNESGLIGDMNPTAGTNYWSFGPNTNGYLFWYAYQSASQTATSTQIPLNTWTHIAVSIQNGRVRQFVNGVLQAFTGDAALTITSSSIGYITMGQWNNSSNYAYFGYVDDFRITRAARYITSFTPPRVALPRQ